MNQGIHYGADVGRKFYRNGEVRFFPGNTIICPFTAQHPAYQKALWVQTQLKTLPFAEKYAFLPPSSFHMTVFGLVNDEDRVTEKWSSKLALGASLEDTDRLFIDVFESVPSPEQLCMRYQAVHVKGKPSIRLVPMNEEHASRLQLYRNAISKATGVRHPDHDSYGFHISLLYQVVELNLVEQEILDERLEKLDVTLRRDFAPFDVGTPRLTFFDDMHAFVSAAKRGELKSRQKAL